MEMNVRTIVLFLGIITTALSAGIFNAWVLTVIPGTKKVPNQAYIEVMQSINREILNPGFFFIFFGSLLLLLISSYLHYQVKTDTTFYLILTATLIYMFGTIGVTMIGNVPLNNMVEALDLSTFTREDFHNARVAYEDKWNLWNGVRTVAALSSFVLLLYTVFRQGS